MYYGSGTVDRITRGQSVMAVILKA